MGAGLLVILIVVVLYDVSFRQYHPDSGSIEEIGLLVQQDHRRRLPVFVDVEM